MLLASCQEYCITSALDTYWLLLSSTYIGILTWLGNNATRVAVIRERFDAPGCSVRECRFKDNTEVSSEVACRMYKL